MDRDAQLPDRCVRCDEPAEGYRRKVTLRYTSTASRLIVGELAYAFAKTATIEAGLCAKHRNVWGRSINAWLLAVALVAASFALLSQGQSLGLLGIVAALAAFVYGLLQARFLTASKLTETHIWVSGCGAPFLASLPDQPSALVSAALAPAIAPADIAKSSYLAVRNGALVFAIGCVITAGTYALASSAGGRFYLAWGAVLIGVIQLIRALPAYLRVPAAERGGAQVPTLAGLVAVGVLALGWVGYSIVEDERWNAALDSAHASQVQAVQLFNEVAARKGPWTAQSASDMAKVSDYYGAAADALAEARAPSASTAWRDAMVSNFREAQAVAKAYAALTASSPQSTFDALTRRWNARIADYNRIQSELGAP